MNGAIVTPARGREAGAERAVSALERSILRTVAYRDLFDFPVTAAEVHRYLHGVPCVAGDVARTLAESRYLARRLVSDGSLYALAGRESLFATRRRRAVISAGLWPAAIAHAATLASLPFVRMVGITGSLAVDNAGDDADIDFMLVTEGGRMWTSRAVAKLVQLGDRWLGAGRLCVNYFVSTRALELEAQSLYVAQELAQMVPVYDAGVYSALRSRNRWSREFLPNAGGPPPAAHGAEKRLPRLQRGAERLLRTPPGDWLESWEAGRKLHRYNDTAYLLGRSTPFRREATGHRRNVRRVVEDAFEDRVRGVEAPAAPRRILIGQAYHLARDPKLFRSMQPFPPLGALYAAAVAREAGLTVRVHDSMLAASPAEWAVALQVHQPQVAVLYEDNFNYLTKMCLATARDAALEMIATARRRGATVYVCSSDSADEPGPYLDAGADAVLVGEGEETLRELLEHPGRDLHAVAGLAFRDAAGEIVRTPRRPVVRRVDSLPEPAWDLVDLRRYAEIWQRRHGRFALNMVTTRGCPYHCNWCAKPIWGQRYNARSPAGVVKELERLRGLAEVDYVWFMDDIFGLKPGWVARFGEQLARAGIRIRFKCLSRPDLLLREGETAALARAGCDIVWMGAESGSQKILDAMEKGTTVEMVETACAALRRQGIRVGLFIQFGYPGETRNDIRATIGMLRRVLPDELGISVSYPLPGTRFYERVEAELGKQRHWRDSGDLAMLFRGPYSTTFYRCLHRYVHVDVAVRRAFRDLSSPARRRALDTRRRLRKCAFLAYGVAHNALARAALGVLSRLPHRGLPALPTELAPEAAAVPTKQDGA